MKSDLIRPQKQHPWKRMMDNAAKLKSARKERRRRYEQSEIRRESKRGLMRLKRGVPLDAPIMKPWDYAMGRVV